MGKGFDTFMENPYWKSIYENAPSTWLQEYYEIMFDTSPFVEGVEFDEKEVETRLYDLLLDRVDIEYLLEHASMAQAKMLYNQCLAVLDAADEGETIRAISCRSELRNPYYTPPAGDE